MDFGHDDSAAIVNQQTVYEALRAAGCAIDSHESDLYVKDTPAARAILRNYGCFSAGLADRFISQIDGCPWFDLPFRYDPFWAAVAGRARRP